MLYIKLSLLWSNYCSYCSLLCW